MRIVIYDAEIENAIQSKGEEPIPGIRYCKGWGDHEGMGISVVAAYVWDEGYRVFMKDNFEAFKALAEAPDTLLVGFNNRVFDDLLVERCWGINIQPSRSWDLLRAIRVAKGMSPAAVGGASLNALCEANFLPPKSGHGAFAPILWQKGKYGQVVDYCLGDVLRTKKMVELVRAGRLRDPESGKVLQVIMPTSIETPDPAQCQHSWEVRNDGYGCRICGRWQLTLDTVSA